ncbi:unnamed protein product [Clonostachys byssicola]|uniref:Aminoglycoside phosphotransferase domain-containing protein n=1 Tax=Clonostachys byssicola TaxID=160290 RepID=A0A9N9UCM4_9HYPO|nr:unnamed protein product [Clonostachys byssicola]
MLPGQHTCPGTSQPDDSTPEEDFDNEVQALLARVNVAELCRAASALSGGRPCRFSTENLGQRKATIKGINLDAWIRFEGGQAWHVRIPRITALSHLPVDLVDSFIQNEYATLKWLWKAGIPAPRCYGYGLASDPSNLVGVSYIFLCVVPGKPFDASKATLEQKLKVYDQYAKILATIQYQTPRGYASSLAHTENKKEDYNVDDAIASDRFTHLGRHGPFRTPLEYFTSIAEWHLQLIADGQLYPEYAREAYVFYKLLKERAAPVLAKRSGPRFWLKHIDDTGDHILVDRDYNIRSIVNWQLARFVPAEEAFGPSLLTANIGQLYGGTPGLGTGDHMLASMIRATGNQELIKFSSSDDLARRFQLGLADGLSRAEVLGLIGAVLKLLYGDVFRDIDGWCKAQWIRVAHDDPRKKKIEELLEAMAAGGA